MLKQSLAKRCHLVGIIIAIVFWVKNTNAQSDFGPCGGCTTVITTNTSANFTVSSGSVVCIAAGVSATGNITLNGGILCNQGTITNVTFIEGTLNNHGTYRKTTGNLNISNAKNLKINCYENSIFDVTNATNIDGATNADSIAITVFTGGVMFSIGKDLSISKGWLKITHSISDGSGRIAVGSTFNVGGQLNINNSMLKLRNYGTFNVNKAINLEGKFTKEIYNYDAFNCNNSLNISGNGQNTSTITIENNSFFNITNHLNSSYNNGVVNISNDLSHGYGNGIFLNAFVIGKSMTLSKDNNSFNNIYGDVIVGQDVNIEKGSVTNSGTITARDFDIRLGTFTNNGIVTANRDFITSNAAAVVNNNYYINILRNFDNKGLLTLGEGALVVTYNFNNTINGYIDGPIFIPGQSDIGDDAKYGLFVVRNNSDNYGYLRNYLSIVDITYAGTSTLTIDDIHNSSAKIASTVISRSVNLPIFIVVPVPFCSGLYLTTTPVTPITVCSGANVVITAQAKNFTFNVSPSNPGYNWSFMVTGAVISGPQNNTYSFPASTSVTLPLTAVVLGCNLSLNVVVNVTNIVVNAGPDQIYVPPTNTTLGPATSSGGTGPYTYVWTPNTYFVSGNTGASPMVAPAVNILYTATATDINGCTGTDQVNVISLVNNLSYAVPRKNVDAGYHLAVSNKVYFKFEEEYRTSTLNYKIYEYNSATPSIVTCPSLNAAKNLGDNRYFIDFTTCGTMTPAKYYLLELINDKSEKFYLKFLR